MPIEQERYERIEGKIDTIVVHVEKIDDTIHGNGRPGLKTLVDRNTRTLATARKVMWSIFGIVGTIAGGLLLAALL